MSKHGWTYKKLTDVSEIQYGFAFDSNYFCEDNSYPQLIRIRDVVRGFSETFFRGEVPDNYWVNKGEYLIGMDGEFNIAPWQSDRALLNQRVCKITSKNSDCLIRFIYYNMQSILKAIEDETPFVTVKHLSAKKLNAVKLRRDIFGKCNKLKKDNIIYNKENVDEWFIKQIKNLN